MLPKIYLETTIPSYLASRPSREIIIAAHQQATHDWWNKHRQEFDLYISEFVLRECRAGDSARAQKRLELLSEMSELLLVPDVFLLAEKLIANGPIPSKAETDALHISAATVGGMDYLLTWNCTHIANAQMQNSIRSIVLNLD